MSNQRQYSPGGQTHSRQQSISKPEVDESALKQIITGGDSVKLNEIANKIGEYCAYGGEREKLSASQVRSILDHLQRMYEFDMHQLQLLRPKMAYAAGRHGGKLRELQEIADKAIVLVGNNEGYFKNFRNFFEAIVAYHRYHGGK
jgi:CRISPR-associated protein Csm2